MHLFLSNFFLLILLVLSIDSKCQHDRINTFSDTTIIRQLMAPFPPDSLNIDFYSESSYAFMTLIRFSLRNNKESRRIAELSLRMATKSDIQTHIGLSYMALITHAQSIVELDNYFNNAIAIFEKEKLQNLKLLTKLHAARKYSLIGPNYTKSFRLINEFLKNYLIKDHKWAYARAWNWLGEINRQVGNNTRALECYNKSTEYSFSNGIIIYRSPYINIGTIHKNLGEYDSAFFYYDMAWSNDTIKNGSHAYILNRKAQTYFLLGQYDSAFANVSESLIIYEAVGNKGGIILALNTLMELQYKLEQFDESIKSGKRALNIALQMEYYPKEILKTCTILIAINERQSKHDNLYDFQKIYSKIYAKLYGPDINQQMLDEQINLELRNMELETSILRERQQLLETKAKTQRITLYVILLALASVSISLALLYKKNKKLDQLNEEKSNMVQIASHDLKSPINSAKGLISIINLSGDKNYTIEQQEAINKLDLVMSRMSNMVKRFLNVEMLDTGNLALNYTRIDVQKTLIQIVNAKRIVALKKDIEIIFLNEIESILINVDKDYFIEVLENLLSNAIKFSPKNRKIHIGLNEMEDHKIRISIKDEGQGISKQDRSKLFQKFQKLSARPTAGESSSGLGLAIVKQFTEAMGGKVWCESKEDEGATFFLEFNVMAQEE